MCTPCREKDETDRAQNQTGCSLRGHRKGRLKIVGIGPGDLDSLSRRAYQAICDCEVVVGYKAYLQHVGSLLAGKEVLSSGMRQEVGRAEKAIEMALAGYSVCLVSSGDPGIYGMAGLLLELLGSKDGGRIDLEIIPGITAASSCASLLGAPLMNDFAVISLSDLLTEPEVIEKRIRSACEGDFVIVFYNPKSKKRVRPLERAWQILMRYRSPGTLVGIVQDATKSSETVKITSLKEMLPLDSIDMGTTLIIGNSRTYMKNNLMVTPRGYKLAQREERQ